MMKKKAIIKWSLIVFVSLIALVFSFGFWFISLIPTNEINAKIDKTLPEDVNYIAQNNKQNRGKILAVVTSCNIMGSSNKETGYELTELSRAYYVFQANGFEVDVASPLGATPPVIIDKDDMGVFDYAFLNDPTAQDKVNHSIPIEQVDPDDYQAVYFVGGKGAMFDFPQNVKIQSIVSTYYQTGKVVGAVCHGPAAFVNVVLEDGSPLLKGKTVSSFTNSEELFLIPEAASIFPFLLQDRLVEQGALFNSGHMYLKNISRDGNLVTGQNPWSTWALAESMIQQLGYDPVERILTSEENSIEILIAYETNGYEQAKSKLEMMLSQQQPINSVLIAMHSIVAAMQWEIGKSFDLINLLKATNQQSE